MIIISIIKRSLTCPKVYNIQEKEVKKLLKKITETVKT